MVTVEEQERTKALVDEWVAKTQRNCEEIAKANCGVNGLVESYAEYTMELMKIRCEQLDRSVPLLIEFRDVIQDWINEAVCPMMKLELRLRHAELQGCIDLIKWTTGGRKAEE